jgi:hypothetical protein
LSGWLMLTGSRRGILKIFKPVVCKCF